MVDARDLKSLGEIHAGSSPALGTTSYYASIAVHKKVIETVADEQVEVGYVLFQRWISKEKVPEDLWRKGVEDIVSFNESERIVTFDLGFTNFTCTLPPPDPVE